ncbi:uncharacterized protein FFM5_09396 [Fusarium fujikuroi]|nr:uncharacterized protein FFM5_09396 [Fusarium fujikuroi]
MASSVYALVFSDKRCISSSAVMEIALYNYNRKISLATNRNGI